MGRDDASVYAGIRIIDIPYRVDNEFTYSVPPEAQPDMRAGVFVALPFGSSDRKMYGVVCSYPVQPANVPRVKSIFGAVHPEYALTNEQFSLAMYIKEHTLCTFSDALRRLLPFDSVIRATEFFTPVKDAPADSAEFTAGQRVVLEYVRSKKEPVSEKRLVSKYDTDALVCARALCTMGYLTRAITQSASKDETFYTVYVKSENGDLSVLRLPRTKTAHREIYSLVCDGDGITAKELNENGYSDAQIRYLINKGLITAKKIPIPKNHYSSADYKKTEYTLNGEQKRAYERLSALVCDKSPHAALLFGVTGSGKTSVMLKVARKTVDIGRKVIILVPEIALTWQSVAVFSAEFGERLAVMHSSLTESERFDAYSRVKRGDVDVVLGTRSAIFAPLSDIGLIVIDEEQEHTYKSDTTPKYHARDIARFRAAKSGALLLLSSATPSVETYYKAESGVYELIKLTERYNKFHLPSVIISDMRSDTSDAAVGNKLSSLLVKTFSQKHQSMLFLNRRGYNSFLSCMACGEAVLCPNCSVALTYHRMKFGGALVCHYCGYRTAVPRVCPKCGSEHISYNGYGTQQLAEEVMSILPDAKIIRMDADSTKARFSRDEMVESFGKGEADILIGTQMIAKGHNFGGVTLVGVTAADNTLFSDDFRANENTFSLITQVIGRSGRGDLPGIAVIQTYNPDNQTIKLAAAQDYERFYKNEIMLRKALAYPPFCDIIAFTISGAYEKDVRDAALKSAEIIRQKLSTEYKDVPTVIYGPFEAPVFKVKNKYRMRIIIKHRDNRRSRELFSGALAEMSGISPSKVTVSADINPTQSNI